MASESEAHTIDNLCKRDKEKVVEILRQLNELRKRCTILESQIESVTQEEQRFLKREAMITGQIESTENKLIEATELSRTTRESINQVSLELQDSEAENRTLEEKISGSEADMETLKEQLRQMRVKYNRILVDTSVVCTPETADVETNCEDKRVLCSAQTQVLNRDLSEAMFDDTELPPGWGIFCEDADDDVTSLITLLNKQ